MYKWSYSIIKRFRIYAKCRYGCKMQFRLKSFNDLVIEDALKDTIARVFSRSSQIPIKIGNKYTYI